MPRLRSSEIDKAIGILIEECGANAGQFDGINGADLTEWRFGGALGFGGKLWWRDGYPYWGQFLVTCYPEDETPERVAMMERANRRFANDGEIDDTGLILTWPFPTGRNPRRTAGRGGARG